MTGLDVEHVRRFEGPVLAERAWAVGQAKTCRIGWEKDSPVLGELVVDRLATRGVEPSSLEWDALREGRNPWQIVLAFVQGAEIKHARWELDLTARSVAALDDEARWLTEAAGARRPAVFDQDSEASGASASRPAGEGSSAGREGVSPDPATAGPPPTGAADSPASEAQADSTDALLADLASNRGRRLEVDPEEDSGKAASVTSPYGHAQVVSMSERRRLMTGNHPAGSKLHPASTKPAPGTEPTARTEEVPEVPTQDALPEMPEGGTPKAKRRSRRSVPSWDEIVFGAKPE